jgi:hypothetical protein
MEQELKKQFRITLFETEVIIVMDHDRNNGYQKNISIEHKLQIGWHDWIDPIEIKFNYHEACGILLLFGITPSSYSELINIFIPVHA